MPLEIPTTAKPVGFVLTFLDYAGDKKHPDKIMTKTRFVSAEEKTKVLKFILDHEGDLVKEKEMDDFLNSIRNKRKIGIELIKKIAQQKLKSWK